MRENPFVAVGEWLDDVVTGKSAHMMCQWRGAVVPTTNLGDAAYISELLRNSHVRTKDESSESGSQIFPEPYTLEMNDGTLVSFLLVRGAKTNMREIDAANKAVLISAKIAAYMNTGRGKTHSFGMYFLHDPNTANQVFQQKIAPMMATAKRIGGDASLLIEDLRSRLVHDAAEEMTLFTVRTHMSALRSDEIKGAQLQYQKMMAAIMASGKSIANMPMGLNSPYGQAILSKSAPILQRHEGIVKTMLLDFNSRSMGISVSLLAVREAFERVKRFGDREIPQSNWTADIFGQDGNFKNAMACSGSPTPLSFGMQVLTRKIVGHIGSVETACIGNTWYGSTVMEIGPSSPRSNPSNTIFSALMQKIKGSHIPVSMSFEIFPNGLSFNRLNQFFNLFLGAIGSGNRQIRSAYRDLEAHQEKNGLADPIVGLRVSFSTWANSRVAAEKALLELNLAVTSWGGAEPNAETGAPDAARLSSIPEYMSGSSAPIIPAPLQDVMYLSPLMRPSSPWEEGQMLFKTNDGVLYPVGIGTSKHAAYVSGYCAPSGFGKSFLLNRMHACMALSPGAQQLPYITNIDVAPSGVGFLRLLRTVLPKEMHRLLVYFKVINSAEYCVNPWDLQLGCSGPTPAERDFQTSVLEIIFEGLSDESSQFIGAMIDEAYRLFSPTATTARLWQTANDARISQDLEKIGFKIEHGVETTVYQVVDALFAAGKIESARIAQRFAVPCLEDMGRVITSDRITAIYGTAMAGQERLLDKAARAIINATQQYPLLANVTRKDLDNARVIVIDLQSVISSASDSGLQFAGMMYLYARHLGARNYFLDVDEINTIVRPQYKEYQNRRVREIQQTPKILTYDEWHNVKRVKAVLSLNEKETRETRKFRIYLNFVTQYMTDYPQAILDGITTMMVVGQASSTQNAFAQKTLGLSDTDLDILETGLDRLGRIWAWFKLRDGPVTAVLNNAVGPLETWCYTTDDKDSPLRNELEHLIGETEAVVMLSSEFPTGSAAAYLDRRSHEMADEVIGIKGETVTSIVARELARKFNEDSKAIA